MKDIAKRLRLKDSREYHELRALVQELVAEGVLTLDEHGRVSYLADHKGERKRRVVNRITGRLSVTRRGVGVVRDEDSGTEVTIPPRFMKTALHGDIVAVVPFARSPRRAGLDEGRVEGEIVEIIERTRTVIVGTMQQGKTFSFVVPDDGRIGRDIYVSAKDAHAARAGDKVLVELYPWEDEHLNPEGRIVEVLGRAGDPRVEVLSVARSFGLPADFPADVEREARNLDGTIRQEHVHGRLDMRHEVCITIDPEDAKDFDDAISYQALGNGNALLGVHIADVSHYVREGSRLDGEALKRGTSVYMVNEVVPMLPERLSTDLCSLRPNVDRLTYSVMMEVTPKGKVASYQIRESVIRSVRRFAYEEVQSILAKGKGDIDDVLLPVHALTKVLLGERRKSGSIDFDTAEAKFKFDKHGLPSEIVKKERLDSHRLVEECMLLANKTVAQHIGIVRKIEHARPFIYRVHDVPDPERLSDLARFVRQFGFSLDVRQGVSTRALQKLLDDVKGSEVENLINEVALRSMAKAVYSEKNIGHYGLGFKYYTHFTSPIRRYPDLVVHRLLKEYERGVTNRRRMNLAEKLPYVCRQSSERERVAQDAERASVKVMQVEYMKRHVGDVFEGVIGGVTEFGIFVEITKLLVEGLVRVRDLADDYYVFDEKKFALRGRSRGRVYRLGDPVKVRVLKVNMEDRQIDFMIEP
jgi:ribonuclease R